MFASLIPATWPARRAAGQGCTGVAVGGEAALGHRRAPGPGAGGAVWSRIRSEAV